MNETLAAENDRLAAAFGEDDYPVYFILAQPRGASTLFQQIVASNLQVGYISNFLARFYLAPLFGMELEKGVAEPGYQSHFNSDYGNTEGLSEPHEWGWFWKAMLGLEGEEHYAQERDFTRLRQNLRAITQTKRLPLLIDNVYAMSNLTLLKGKVGNIRLVNLTRDLYYICNSILNARLSRYGDVHAFYGHPPRNIEEVLRVSDPVEQVVFQVKSIQDEIDATLAAFDPAHIMHVDYEEIHKDSVGVVERFRERVNEEGHALARKAPHFPELSYRNDPALVRPEFKERLDHYYQHYFGAAHD